MMNSLKFCVCILCIFVMAISCNNKEKLPNESNLGCGIGTMDHKVKHTESLDTTSNSFETLELRMTFFITKEFSDYSIFEKNLDVLNNLLTPYIRILPDTQLYYYKTDKDLVILRDNFISGGNFVDNMISSYALKGNINVFVLPTYSEENLTLNGFTPVYKDWDEGYEIVSPLKDNLFISIRSLNDNSLCHEFGHLFSLRHPWELQYDELTSSGLRDSRDVCINIMNYNCYTNDFTMEQLEQMYTFLVEYRSYLIL